MAMHSDAEYEAYRSGLYHDYKRNVTSLVIMAIVLGFIVGVVACTVFGPLIMRGC